MAEYDFKNLQNVSEREYGELISQGYSVVSWDGIYGHNGVFKKLAVGGQDINQLLSNMSWQGDDLYINGKPITDPDNAPFLQDIANAGYTYAELKKRRKKNTGGKDDPRKYYSGVPDYLSLKENNKSPILGFIMVIGVGYLIYKKYYKR